MINQKHMKIFFLCALTCFILAFYLQLNYYDNFYLLRIKHCVPSSSVHGCERQDCLAGIIQILKVVSLNDTGKDIDLNLKALDMLITTVQTYIKSNGGYITENRDLDDDLRNLEELRNEVRTRQMRGVLQESMGKVDNDVKETEGDSNKLQNETQRDIETNYEAVDQIESADNYDQYEYRDYQYQETQESEEGSDINLAEVLTIVLNFNNYTYKDMANVNKTLKDITNLFPGVHTMVCSPFKLNPSSVNKNITIISIDKRTHPVTAWSTLVDLVNTTHVLILRDVVSIDENSRIRSLLYNMKSLGLDVIGGAIKSIHNGHWDMGCYQMAYRNYVLVYKSGYRHSNNSCVYCHDIGGPFIAKTSVLKRYSFTDGDIPEELIFHDFFFNQFKNKSKFVVCPDSMFVTRTKPAVTDRSQWLRFALENNIHRVIIPDRKTYTYTCEELGVEKNFIDDGKSVPYCTIQELVNHIKFIMRTCRENLIICELSWGIELGALKLNGIPPWEHDGDVSFYTPQAEKLMALKPLFEEHGYSLYYHRYTGEWDSPWLRSNSKWWHVDLFNRTKLDSADLILQGKSPTKVLFDGDWVETSNNVGYSAKRGYGPEIYKHKDYSMTYSQSYLGLHYVRCPDGGGHDCIDQMPSDGNFNMGDPKP